MSVAQKRIVKDLLYLEKNPIPNITYHVPDNNIMLGHATITIQDGVYKDIPVHLKFEYSIEYPFVPPSVKIADGFPFTHKNYPYVMKDSSICCNLTEFYFKHHKGESGGWCATSSIHTILMQLSIFFNVPKLPETSDLEKLKSDISKFECSICNKL